MTDTDVLWGGKLISFHLDPVTWTLAGRVEVLAEGFTRQYDLVLEKVGDIHVERRIELPWTYAQMTEVHVSEVAEGVAVEFVLWEDGTGCTVRCAGMRVVEIE